MILTFPHMGNTYITIKALLDDLNIRYIIPPFNNQRALELGTRYAPEMACLPLKINIGNFIEAYEKGADSVLITGGCGPCRFGYYSQMHREILRDIGYEMDVIALESPYGNWKGFVHTIQKLTGGLKALSIIKAIQHATQLAVKVDNLEQLCFKIRPREKIKGSTDRLYKGFLSQVKQVEGSKKINQLIDEVEHQLLDLEIDKEFIPLKIGIVGEIYTTIDSYSSFEIQSMLGKSGVEVDRRVTVSGWILEHMLKKAFHLPRDLRYQEAAKPYLGAMIGGHAQETVGNTVLYAQNGYDGVIQIYPLTCMPEIVAESILPAVEADMDIPVLTLIIDELTGEAGYMTRIEAFMDLLVHRRERRGFERKWAFSGN